MAASAIVCEEIPAGSYAGRAAPRDAARLTAEGGLVRRPGAAAGGRRALRAALARAFLPEGYPHSVTPDSLGEGPAP